MQKTGKSSDEWRILNASDIHLGHNKVKIPTIAANLRQYYLPYIEQCNLLVLEGDVFDRMLAFGDVHSNMILSFITELLTLANKYGVVVRVLRGTFTHDRTQCSVFATLYKDGGFTNDFKYIDVMSCEYIESLDMKVLFIPDDLPYESADEAIQVAHEMLDKMKWKKFDYVFGHGYFDHMFPPNIPHRPKCNFHLHHFKDIVTRHVIFGHLHTSDITEFVDSDKVPHFVIYNGSFERLNHGEEERKGFIWIVDNRKDAQITFVENKNATKFITLDLSGKSTEEAIISFKSAADKYKNEHVIHLRVVHESAEVRTLLQKYCRQTYGNIDFSVKALKTDKREQLRSKHLIELSAYHMPTPDNLATLVYEHVCSSFGENALSLEQVAETLNTL